jgi:hypothetical protein
MAAPLLIASSPRSLSRCIFSGTPTDLREVIGNQLLLTSLTLPPFASSSYRTQTCHSFSTFASTARRQIASCHRSGLSGIQTGMKMWLNLENMLISQYLQPAHNPA